LATRAATLDQATRGMQLILGDFDTSIRLDGQHLQVKCLLIIATKMDSRSPPFARRCFALGASSILIVVRIRLL
jgi:hypothetical protein